VTLRLETQSIPGGAFTAVDIAAERIAQIKVTVGISHPAIMSWVMYQPEHTIPIPVNTFIRFWDDAETDPDGNPFTAANPIFEGFVAAPSPGGESNLVRYTAFDSTHMAAREIPVMSLPWVTDGVAITEGIGAIPRLVLNAKIDNDPDYAFERAHDATVGGIIAGILGDAILPLRYFNAAPASANAYDAGELALLAFRPQEKMVFESESLWSAVTRLLQKWYPACRMVYHPGTDNRKWRIFNFYDAPARTLTLNDYSGDDRILSWEIHRSYDDRFTAVQAYGPPTSLTATFSTLDGTLSTYGAGTILEQYTDAGGLHDVVSYTAWQITDPDFRAGTRLLPDWVYVPVGGTLWVATRYPTLQYSFDGGSTWNSMLPNWDFLNGIAGIGNSHIYIYVDPPPVAASNQQYFVPDAIRIVYAYYTFPLTSRFPVSGFSGTAYTVGNVQTELKVYDEMLAVGYERGIPVTTPTRLGQFATLVEAMQRQRRDEIYVGGCVLEGLRYDFLRLNRAVNFASIDGDGNPIVTSWEDIGAIVTDVEYDYGNNLTTLTFSSDQLELCGFDIDVLHARLRIKALWQIREYHLVGHIAFAGNSSIWMKETITYVDPDTLRPG
jgi:hypothetical protein